jgi:hypothetical protein
MVVLGPEGSAQHETSPQDGNGLFCTLLGPPPTFSRRQHARVFRPRPEPALAGKSDHGILRLVRTQVVVSAKDNV